jgi:erythromycin esterase-like protein
MAEALAEQLPELIRNSAEPLPDIDDDRFGAFFDRFADARVVLLGEASHGTSEFYRARAAISKRLIAHHGFNIVAVEADWPDAATSTATSVTGRSAKASRPRSSASRPGCGETVKSTASSAGSGATTTGAPMRR